MLVSFIHFISPKKLFGAELLFKLPLISSDHSFEHSATWSQSILTWLIKHDLEWSTLISLKSCSWPVSSETKQWSQLTYVLMFGNDLSVQKANH